ncbi:conserved hypothetical protein [Ricinus communis]|uniref:Uncharacterized protein n=1 Tax=Ricinus communis TaxID=3988 RepID=B9RS92_RICCO|nr:conserved hypothetical protein [Ricinus communis]
MGVEQKNSEASKTLDNADCQCNCVKESPARPVTPCAAGLGSRVKSEFKKICRLLYQRCLSAKKHNVCLLVKQKYILKTNIRIGFNF